MQAKNESKYLSVIIFQEISSANLTGSVWLRVAATWEADSEMDLKHTQLSNTFVGHIPATALVKAFTL